MAHYDQHFQYHVFSNSELRDAIFDGCNFSNCSFEGVRLDHTEFIGCHFSNCNFTGSLVINTALKEVKFDTCKLLGFDFSACSDFLFRAGFDNCLLDNALFNRKNLKNTGFKNSSVREADFNAVELSNASFAGSDLAYSRFENCLLAGCDFRNTQNLRLDPDLNRVKGALFTLAELPGLLEKYKLKIE